MSSLPCALSDADVLHRSRRRWHGHCFACGDDAPGLRLKCHATTGGRVEAILTPLPWMRGYDDRLHGGIVAAVLDSAMTQCLFAQGIRGLTVSLEVRYVRPAPGDRTLNVAAQLDDRRHSLLELSARLMCGHDLIARAKARFVESSVPRR